MPLRPDVFAEHAMLLSEPRAHHSLISTTAALGVWNSGWPFSVALLKRSRDQPLTPPPIALASSASSAPPNPPPSSSSSVLRWPRPALYADEGTKGSVGSGEVMPEVGELYPHPAHDEAVSLLEEGDWAAALEKAEECLSEAPQHRGCYDDRLRALLASGDMDAARDIVASCAEERSNDPALCGSSGILLALEEGDLAGAEELLVSLEEESPKSRFTMMARGQVFAEQGEDKMARVNYSLACIQGHAIACKKAPGVKKAGGE